ncbi:MAG: hypothetical protein EXS36_16915 [Pedosphaera sp.]|nr:hypothetical protein [Pedosphaera sp.]
MLRFGGESDPEAVGRQLAGCDKHVAALGRINQHTVIPAASALTRTLLPPSDRTSMLAPARGVPAASVIFPITTL